MSFESFLQRYGFNGDPFASTNSEQEERLADYFVPPPYFESVLGTPADPKTSVVFAPRGSGKTAQRLMIEKKSGEEDSGFLCLTYDNFSAVLRSKNDLASHQRELCRLVTIGILSRLEEDPAYAVFLTEHERQVVKAAAQSFLGTLSIGEYEQAVKSVKTLGDKASDFWSTYGGPVALGINLLLNRAGLKDVTVDAALQVQRKDAIGATVEYFLGALCAVANKLDWRAIYFLVDKVDETPSTTTDSDAAGRLIGELITSLPTLELPTVAFKFFFWDQMRSYLVGRGLRGDRMEVVTLRWSVEELSEMLSRRLSTYSSGKINSFNALVENSASLDVHKLLAYLSNGSPRDMIRMARSIVTEHTRMTTDKNEVPKHIVFTGVQEFSRQVTSERYSRFLTDFSRVGEPSYTLTGLAAVFKITTTGVKNKTDAWISAGAVRSLGTKANPGKKPLNLYGFTDARIVLASSPVRDVEVALDNYVLQCEDCKEMVVVGESELDCPKCGGGMSVGSSRSLLDLCSS